MPLDAENLFKTSLQQAIFACATSLDALKASRTQAPEIPENKPSPTDVRSDFISILTLLYARSTSLTLVLNAGPDSYSAAREPLADISRDITRLAHCAGLFSVVGPTIRSEAIWATEEVVGSIQTYLLSFTRSKATQATPEDSKSSLMLRVGTIHGTIDQIKSSFSVDNHAAIAKRWQSDASHLDDAMREVKEIIEEAESDDPGGLEDNFDDGWGEITNSRAGKLAEHEVETAKKVMLILRMVALLHKRILLRIITPWPGTKTDGTELERLLSLSSELAARIDDMAASLWSPQDPQQIAARAAAVQKRADALRESLISSGSLPSGQSMEPGTDSHVDSKDVEWFQMCFSQIDKAVSNISNV